MRRPPAAGQPRRPGPTRCPDQVIDGPRTVLTIGGEEVQLIYPGPNHEVGNILVHSRRRSYRS